MGFILYCIRFALTLHLTSVKLGGISTIKINGIYFVLYSICTNFTFNIREVRRHLNNKNKWDLFCIVFDLH